MISNTNTLPADERFSHDLDFVAVYSEQGAEAKLESVSIQALLAGSGIPCTIIGSQQIPSLPFEVRVPKVWWDDAQRLLEQIHE